VLRFLATRVSLVVPTFIGMTLLAFFLIRLVPGDRAAVGTEIAPELAPRPRRLGRNRRIGERRAGRHRACRMRGLMMP
jgi:ABC-type dipeptide/oligopeptide/nickel transport system permease component